MTKTNVMRLLDAAGIEYSVGEYEVDEHDLSGSHAADVMGVRSLNLLPAESPASVPPAPVSEPERGTEWIRKDENWMKEGAIWTERRP